MLSAAPGNGGRFFVPPRPPLPEGIDLHINRRPGRVEKVSHLNLAVLLCVALSASALRSEAGRRSFRPLPRKTAPESGKPTAGKEIKALISGIREGANYRVLPPVQVRFEGLPNRTAVWAELYRGPAKPEGRGLNVPARLVPRGGGNAVLTIRGLDQKCAGFGTWTLSVMISDSQGTRILARKTFSTVREN